MNRLLLFLCLWLPLQAHAIGSYAVDDTLYVFTPAGLKLRTSAKLSAGAPSVLPYGAAIVVKELTVIHEEIEEVPGYKIRGSWVKVSFGNKEGFVFDGYLSSYKPPTMTEGTAAGETFEQYLQTHYKGKNTPMPFGKTGKEFNTLLERGMKWTKRVAKNGLDYGRLQIDDMTLEEAYLIANILCRSSASAAAKADYSDATMLVVTSPAAGQLIMESANKKGLSLRIVKEKEEAPLIIHYRMLNGTEVAEEPAKD